MHHVPSCPSFDRLGIKDDNDLAKLEKLPNEAHQATGKLIKANLQAANEATIKAAQARMNHVMTFLARCSSNRGGERVSKLRFTQSMSYFNNHLSVLQPN